MTVMVENPMTLMNPTKPVNRVTPSIKPVTVSHMAVIR